MRRRVVVCALTLTWCVSGWAEEPVGFGDGTLQAVVEETLWITNPTPTDMLGFTYLEARGMDITSVKGLEYALNLLTLRLGDNQYISDLTPLASLVNLRTLTLNQNRIEDISPLADLVEMMELDIHHNLIHDISAVSRMTRLRMLAIRENPIRDISPLAGIVNIRTLILSCTEVRDISPLLSMRSLEHLDLRECPLDRSAYDTYIPQIQANNPNVQIRYDPLREYTVRISSSDGGTVTYPGEGEFTFETGSIILLIAKPEPGCIFQNWSGTFAGTENPTSVTISQSHEIQANFLDLSDTLFVDDTSLSDPGPGDATISDPREDGTMPHPFDTIQEAIDAATDGMSVFVRPGRYRENIDLQGKNIRLTGMNSDQPDDSQLPAIEGTGSGTIVSFVNGEGPDCTLTGFVITRGVGEQAAAMRCEQSSPTIANCLIVGNRSTHSSGAAVYCRQSQAVFANCTIADNVAGWFGAAMRLVDSNVRIHSSIFWNNSPAQIQSTDNSTPRIEFCDVANGWSDVGIIDADPLFVGTGYWANADDPTRVAKTIDGNSIWVDGDYHLKSQAGRRNVYTPDWHTDYVTSPAIDAGDPRVSPGEEPSPNGSLINLGAYGGTRQASKSTRN